MNMKKKFLSTLLTSAIVVSAMPMSVFADDPNQGSIEGGSTVLAPTEIIDVIVPTKFDIAFNPVGVTVTDKTSGYYNNSAQILSGSYVIQNRSTVPVELDVAFNVTSETGGAKMATAADVAADDATADSTAVPQFSLDVVTTATTQTLTDAKLADKSNLDDLSTYVEGTNVRPNKNANSKENTALKLGKLSTTPIALTDVTKAQDTAKATTVKFVLAAGPYTTEYQKAEDGTESVKYVAKGTAFDGVGFTFTGTTSTSAKRWTTAIAGKATPKVAATYTLKEMTTSAYSNTNLSLTSKAVMVDASSYTDIVTITRTLNTDKKSVKTLAATYPKVGTKAGTNYIFATAPSVTMKNDAPTGNATLLSLKPNSKAANIAITELGTYTAAVAAKPATDTEAAVAAADATFLFSTDVATSPLAQMDADGNSAYPDGLYQVTIGKQNFMLNITSK